MDGVLSTIPEEFECFSKYVPMHANRALADRILMEFVEENRKLDLQFHLREGVCFGFVREGTYLPYDNDIDLIVHCNNDEVWEQLMAALRARGFVLPNNNYGAHIIKDKIMLDVAREDDTPSKFDVVTYNGVEFNVPYPVEDYLKKMYGSEWMIAVPTAEIPEKYDIYGDYTKHLKIKRLEEEKARVISEKVRVGYTFVVADLLHLGHVKTLDICKEHCDWLIVGVLTDEATESYKRKPIIPFRQRKQLITSLKSVDYVVTQYSRDPTEIMKELVAEGFNIRILFHCCGWKTIPGTEYIKSIGGHLLVTQDYKDLPRTSQIIEECKKR